MKGSYLAVVLLCSILHFQLDAQAQQDMLVESITADDGLSQGMIYDILQDREGFIWIATKDGLNRYDGYEFSVFTNDPQDPWSISGNTIIKLFEDSKGRIWAASDNSGLNIYDKLTGRFHHIKHDPNNPSSLSGNYVNSIVEDTSGYFICAVDLQEICMFKLEDDFFNKQISPKVIRIQMPAQKNVELFNRDGTTIGYVELRTLQKDANHQIWVSGNNSMYQLQINSGDLTLAKNGISMIEGFKNPDGTMWIIAPDYSLYYWSDEKTTLFGNFKNGIRKVFQDASSNLWALSNSELLGFDMRGWNQFESNRSVTDRCFYKKVILSSQQNNSFINRSLLIDRSGLIWIGTQGYGLKKINPANSRFSHQFQGTSIRNFNVDQNDNLNIQEYTSTWYSADGSCYKEVGIDYPGSCFGGDILVSKSGVHWVKLFIRLKPDNIDYNYTISKYDPINKKQNTIKLSWHHNLMQPMLESKDGSIWLAGMDDVLSRIDPVTNAITNYNSTTGQLNIPEQEPQRFSVHLSTALYEDNDQVLWVGSERGFSKCVRSAKSNPLQVTHYINIPRDENSLSYNHVTSFLDDPTNPEKYLWVATKGGGLNRLDKETNSFLCLTKADGLPDDVVYGILADDAGNIWGSTNRGLFCMMNTSLGGSSEKKNFTFRNFTKRDGLQDNEFNTGAFAKLADGRLVFGGINGYNIFDPKAVLADQYAANTYITKILVNNKEIRPGDSTGILVKTIESTPEIVLSYLDNILTLEFASLDFTAPSQNKYRYQFTENGASDNWVEAGNSRSATFLNLQPDNYTFRVQGSNSQGDWNEHIAELNVVVLPPWWKTTWAYLFYAILIVSTIWMYFRFSINRERLQQQLAFEKLEAERIKDLDSLKTQLYMNMTHEFRTPLTVILGMAKQMRDNPKADSTRNLDMVINNGRSLLGMVNQMLNLSRLESGKMSLQMVQGDAVHFLRNLVESFRSFMSDKEIQLHFLPEVDTALLDYDSDKLKQIISNLLSNAFKFTPEKGHVYVSLRKEKSNLVIRVKDTGKGIPKRDTEKIFDRFYQVDNTTTRKYEGSGIGLALAKELAILMGGTISVLSPPAGARIGSEFTVLLPISNKGPIANPHLEENIEKDVDELTKTEEITHSSTTDQSSSNVNEKPLILITEDNEDVATYVSSCLHSDYRLAIAKNGQEGLELAIELTPDLIVSDVMMPIMDGFEFCRKVKMDPRTDHIPVIILTARADFDSKLEGLELGANAYLPKPFEEQELQLTIKNLFTLRNKQHRHYRNHGAVDEPESFEEDTISELVSEDPFVIKVRTLILEKHLSNPDLSVEQLAKEVFLSHSQFGRKLSALTGISPNKFIRSTRLTQAKELMQNEELSITEISYACGFNDPSYFTRVFKKEFGKSPQEMRGL